MLWLLLVVSMNPLHAENNAVDSPYANSSMLLDFTEQVVTLGGVFPTQGACLNRTLHMSPNTTGFCVQSG